MLLLTYHRQARVDAIDAWEALRMYENYFSQAPQSHDLRCLLKLQR